MAHGSHASHAEIIQRVRRIGASSRRPLGVLVDLAGPKIRLGRLREDPTHCFEGQVWRFVRQASGEDDELTCTYDRLVNELDVGDRVMMADGAVAMVVIRSDDHEAACKVTAAGVISSRQGVNLPGARLSVPALTDKDREDVIWAANKRSTSSVLASFVAPRTWWSFVNYLAISNATPGSWPRSRRAKPSMTLIASSNKPTP